MTGRGIDQILPHPSRPELHEPAVQDARRYVDLAEEKSGPIPRSAFFYVWGDALEGLRGANVRIVNLETSVTRSDSWEPKGINYRMHPDNVGVLTVARIDCCSLANNHVLDWGRTGLEETIRSLRAAGVKTVGAGENLAQAEAPATFDVSGKGRVVVYGFGSVTSGIPAEWAATETRAGVNLLEDLSPRTLERVAARIRDDRRARDVVVASIHWGGNWGYDIPAAERRFAHGLVEAGVDVVHGHSSHHVKGVEVHRGRLILYGAGDFLNDYEGIEVRPDYPDQLAIMYFPAVDPVAERLLELRMVPMRIRRFRLARASTEDSLRLRDILAREGERLGTRVTIEGDGTLTLLWGDAGYG
jgi:poly-gamma-glutamate synthesis protein (capsule biosynthesis protein)